MGTTPVDCSELNSVDKSLDVYSFVSDVDSLCEESKFLRKVLNPISNYDPSNLNFDDDIDSINLTSKNVSTLTSVNKQYSCGLITSDESKKQIDKLNNEIEKLFSSMAKLQEENSVIILSSDDDDDAEVTKQIDSIGISSKAEAFISPVSDKSKCVLNSLEKNQRFATSTPKFNFNESLKTSSRQENFEFDVLESVETHKQTSKKSSAKSKLRFRDIQDIQNIQKKRNSESIAIASKESLDAELAEREKTKRLKQKALLRSKIFSRFSGKIVLDFDQESGKILVEVDRAFVSILKKHQIEGVQFMFDCAIESVRRFANEEEEKKNVENGASFGGILAHCMGLGKTLQAIVFVHTILTHRIIQRRISRILIVVPYNVFKNWVHEFNYWFGYCQRESSFELFELNSAKRDNRMKLLRKWRQEGGVMLITSKLLTNLCYDQMKSRSGQDALTITKCLLNPGPDMVIIDEGHMVKNEESRLNQVVSQMRTLRRILLTGTPIQNNLREYHSMMNFAKPNLLGTAGEFVRRFYEPIQEGQFVDSTDSAARLSKQLQYVLHQVVSLSIHRRDYQILLESLSPISKCEFVISVPITQTQKQLYQYYLKRYVWSQTLDIKSPKRYLFVHYMLLRYIWNHPAMLVEYFEECKQRLNNQEELNYDDDEWDKDDDLDHLNDNNDKRVYYNNKNASNLEVVRHIIGEWPYQFIPEYKDTTRYDFNLSPKFQLLLSIVSQCEVHGDKLLIFSYSRHVLNSTEKLLETKLKMVKGREFLRIDGSGDERHQIIQQINDVDNVSARLLLISTRAGGVGINLHGANRAIIFDVSWNPATDTQAIYRIFRYGQKKQVFVYRLAAAGTMEEQIYKRQVTKESMALQVLDQKQIKKYYTQGDLHELYDLHFNQKCSDLSVIASKDQLLDKLIQFNSDLIVKIHEHNSLLEDQPELKLNEKEQKLSLDRFYEEQELAMEKVMAKKKRKLELNSIPAKLLHPAPTTPSASTHQIQRIFKLNGNPTESEKDILSKILSKSDLKSNLLTTDELIRKIELYIEGARYELNSFANLPQNRKVELLKMMKDGASLKEKMPDWCPI